MLIVLCFVTIANDELFLHMEMVPKTNSVTTKIQNIFFLTPHRLKREDDLLKVSAPEM